MGAGDHAREHEVSTFSDHKASLDRNYSEDSSLRNSLACNIKPPEIDIKAPVLKIKVISSSKIHLHVEQFSLKTNWRLAERLPYNQGCRKDPHGIR